ncbi:MAG TPA: ATP-binding cassette domain-containing protein [Bordetella sp.]
MNLVLTRIGKAWGGLRVLDEVSMTVDGGAITGLIGPNGAGKSTLFAAISGNVPVDSGSISLDGLSLDSLGPGRRARLGLMRTFQVPRPFANLTVRQNLAVAVRAQPGESLLNVFFRPGAVRRVEQEIAARAEEVIGSLNLARVADRMASQLSGGQLKLLELGRLLMTRPRLILLDEPFAGVNPVLAEEIADRIRALHAQGLGFFIVEHNLGALSKLVATLFAMDRGTLIASGAPDEVLANDQVRTAYVGG